MPKPYDRLILEEGGFKVEFSNRGIKPKKNPNPVNYKKEIIQCRAAGCEKHTKSVLGLCPAHTKDKPLHIVDWVGRIIPPGHSREDCLTDAPAHYRITEILIKWMKEDDSRIKIMDSFIQTLLDKVVGEIPGATTLYNNMDGHIKGVMRPDDIVSLVKDITDEFFPEESFGDVRLDGGTYRKKSLKDIPLRIVVSLLSIAFVCEESNRGDMWFCKKYYDVEKSRYASAFMPTVYYLLRRYTKATETQARMSLKG